MLPIVGTIVWQSLKLIKKRVCFLKNIVASGGRIQSLSLDDSKKWMLVANQDSDSIAIFRVCENGKFKTKRFEA